MSDTIPERYRVQVALMTGMDAEGARRMIEGCWDLDLLGAAWARARELGQDARALLIVQRMDKVRGS